LTVRSDGDLEFPGRIRRFGTLFLSVVNESTALGVGAMPLFSENSTAVGYFALATGLGSLNTATGSKALYGNRGSFNTATGVNALYANFVGNANTATGSSALLENTSGSYNTAIGIEAGYIGGLNSNTTGSSNTFIGAYSGLGTSIEINNATAI